MKQKHINILLIVIIVCSLVITRRVYFSDRSNNENTTHDHVPSIHERKKEEDTPFAHKIDVTGENDCVKSNYVSQSEMVEFKNAWSMLGTNEKMRAHLILNRLLKDNIITSNDVVRAYGRPMISNPDRMAFNGQVRGDLVYVDLLGDRVVRVKLGSIPDGYIVDEDTTPSPLLPTLPYPSE